MKDQTVDWSIQEGKPKNEKREQILAWVEAQAAKAVRPERGESMWTCRRGMYVLTGDMN